MTSLLAGRWRLILPGMLVIAAALSALSAFWVTSWAQSTCASGAPAGGFQTSPGTVPVTGPTIPGTAPSTGPTTPGDVQPLAGGFLQILNASGNLVGATVLNIGETLALRGRGCTADNSPIQTLVVYTWDVTVVSGGVPGGVTLSKVQTLDSGETTTLTAVSPGIYLVTLGIQPVTGLGALAISTLTVIVNAPVAPTPVPSVIPSVVPSVIPSVVPTTIPQQVQDTLQQILAQGVNAVQLLDTLAQTSPAQAALALQLATQQNPSAAAQVTNALIHTNLQSATQVTNTLALTNPQAAGQLASSLVQTNLQSATQLTNSMVTTNTLAAAQLANALVQTNIQAATQLTTSLVATNVQNAGQLNAALSQTNTQTAAQLNIATTQANPVAGGQLLAATSQTNVQAAGAILTTMSTTNAQVTVTQAANAAKVDPVNTVRALVAGPSQNPQALASLGRALPAAAFAKVAQVCPGGACAAGWRLALSQVAPRALASGAELQQAVAASSIGTIAIKLSKPDVAGQARVDPLPALPAGVPALPAGEVVAGFFNVTPVGFTNQDVLATQVLVQVSKQWVLDNNISPLSVHLFRYDETQRAWQDVLAKVDDSQSSDTAYQYVAMPSGLSVWAVTGETNPPPVKFVVDRMVITPDKLNANQNFLVQFAVQNQQDKADVYNAVLFINDLPDKSGAVTLNAGEQQTVSFVTQVQYGGNYSIRVDRLLTSVQVAGPAPPPVQGGDIAPTRAMLGAALGIGALLMVAGLWVLKRRPTNSGAGA